MFDENSFIHPETTQEDIDWSISVMGLPAEAFNDEARKKALLSRENIDIAACPGSGKTTLLVAKLAILARKWKERTRGICVLSHTNAAREVIQERLGSTAEGQTLLSYPHYIGTIHGFVDRFLGIPWLKANGFPVNTIDTDITLNRRWRKLSFVTRQTLEKKHASTSNLRISNTNFGLHPIPWGKGGILGPHTPTYQRISEACQQTAEDGYFCYEDIFLWAKDFVSIVSGASNATNFRFPLLFIDEAQDNSELQSSILHEVFATENCSTICQRFGDANQAIYHSLTSKDAPTTWIFPNPDLKHEIPDSHRFGPTIAKLAQPLGVEAHELIGRGPDQRRVATEVDDQHTIFLFEESASAHVLPAYSNHLKSIFPARELASGSFIAVGAKHREPKDEKNKPNSVCDYWEKYGPAQATAEPRPESFIGYLQTGHAKTQRDPNHNLHHIVEQIAAGLIEAVRRSGGKVPRVQRKSRYVREQLIDHPIQQENYQEFIRRFGVDNETLTPEPWRDSWKAKMLGIIETLCKNNTETLAMGEFLDWPQNECSAHETPRSSILYQDSVNAPKIRLGSIHSVKGETHTSVLILETYRNAHNMKSIKKWILGKESTPKQRFDKSSKLKVQYVAMTRPTHLLCLAFPDTTFSDDELATLSDLGWRITKIASDGNTTNWVCPQFKAVP